MLATMQTLAMVISARAAMLLAVLGAFVLALLAVNDPTLLKFYLTLGFYAGVVIPVTGLYFWRG